MKCPKCGSELNGNVCPVCNTSVVVTNTSTEVQTVNTQQVNDVPLNVNPFANSVNTGALSEGQNIPANNVSSQNVENEISSTNKKDMSKIYYAILALVIVIFVILMGIILIKNFKGTSEPTVVTNPTTTTNVVETILTKNKGVYTNLASPIDIGNITYGGLYDKNSDKTVDADVEIIRHLTETEINSLIVTANQELNPGFRWDGVEYRVTLNDFDYLGENSINPTMKVYLFDTYYKNNFFLVDENYFTISPINGNGVEIRNGESANLMVAYQVPENQNYYICFGENFSSLGCFINS